MYGFCSSNALYWESPSLRIFIFILTPFDAWNCYYFGLNLSLVLLIKVFFVFNRYFIGAILSKKVLPKVREGGRVWKNEQKRENDHIGKFFYRKGGVNLLHTMNAFWSFFGQHCIEFWPVQCFPTSIKDNIKQDFFLFIVVWSLNGNIVC